MKNEAFRSLGFDIKVSVPETVEEFDKLAGKPGACLDEAISNVVYRGVLAGVRYTFAEKLEAASGVKRKTIDTGEKRKVTTKSPDVLNEDGTVKTPGVETTTEEPILEYAPEVATEQKYINFVRAAKNLSPEAFVLQYQSLMDEVVALPDNKFDPTQTESKPKGPKVLGKQYSDAALRVFTNGTVERNVKRIKDESGIEVTFIAESTTDVEQAAKDRAVNVERLGWAIKGNEDHKAKLARESYA